MKRDLLSNAHRWHTRLGQRWWQMKRDLLSNAHRWHTRLGQLRNRCRGPFAQGIKFDNMSDGGCIYDRYHMHGMGMMGGLPYEGFRFIVGMGWI